MTMPLSSRVRTFVVASLGLAALAAPALAADPAGVRVATLEIDVPACDAPEVLGRIRSDFEYGALHVDGRTLAIAEFGRVRSQGAGVNDPSPIAHRWCYAPVTLTDGKLTTAYWRIDRLVGFAAPGYVTTHHGIESCVLGHDRWRVHDGTCRTARRWW